ncbi:MAG: RnfABCDGE type electron transport complex subunit D [Clostridia bacterium]|nr:RnfABCDGE type electron transport complex subunit D [Clostridia bacterium]
MAKYIVSSSPHITSNTTTQKIMLDVIIALIPATIAAFLIYGLYPIFIMILSVGCAVTAEWLFNLITKRPQSVKDLSAIVTGMILALNLPPVVPFYVPMVGSFFAIIIVKMLFGGIGRNFANPALTARIFLVLCWAGVMTKFVYPIDLSNGMNLFSYFENVVNINLPVEITSATPLAGVKEAIEKMAKGEIVNPAAGLNALDMFLGRIGGSAGEVSTLAILIGALYLLIKRVIDWKIPVLYIGSVVVFTAIFFANSPYVGEYVWTYLLGGGLMFGAFFMATDYATSPKAPLAVCIYGVGLGLLTVIFRKFGSMNEGVSFAILLMNVVTPLLEKLVPCTFGAKSKWETNGKKIAEWFKKVFSKKQKSEEKEAQNG